MGRLAGRSGASIVLALMLLGLTAGSGVARAQLSLVGTLDPYVGDDRYGDIWGEGDFAYIGSFQGTGVGIIDISDPTTPALVTTYGAGVGGRFKDLKVRAGIGYFASDNGGGLHIVDLADPGAPVLLAQITSADGGYDSIHNVTVEGGFLYQANSTSETVVVFDVVDPANPTFVRDIVTPDAAFIHDVTAIGTRLYASGFGGFTYVYDVAGIGSVAPTLLGSVPSGANSHSSWATSDGELLIIAREISNGDVKIFDISNPAAPVLLSSLDRTSLGIDATSPHNPVLFDDTLLFVSWYEAGVVAIDLSDPSNPALVGQYDTFPGGAAAGYDGNWGVYPLLGLDRVLLSDLDAGLVILDATGLRTEAVPALSGSALLLLAGLLVAAGRRRQSVRRPG